MKLTFSYFLFHNFQPVVTLVLALVVEQFLARLLNFVSSLVSKYEIFTPFCYKYMYIQVTACKKLAY